MNSIPEVEKIAVVLIGHGAPATDCPPRLVGELMGLQWCGDGHAPGGHPSLQGRAEQLDSQIRNWPRHPGNDPYREGLERVAAALRERLPGIPVAIGYNEFCFPSVPQVMDEVIRQGANRVLVIPSMLTPGGLHSQIDIPRTLDQIRGRYPGVSIEYLWPFDLTQVATLLASHIRNALQRNKV